MGGALKKLLHLVAGALAFFAVTATAAVLNVPGTYATISAAVAAAAPNDIIQCAPGLYAAPGDTVVGIGIPLTLRGAQAGNDARPRGAVAPNPVTETVVAALGKWTLNSANITIDGFYFTDIGLRSIEGSEANVDNISISNCVLLASTGNQGNQGNIQFAGGPSRTLHNFVFQQNYVHNPASGFLYISHTANNGVIRDNYINCGYFGFGPFPVWSGGALVSMPMGWVIAGNEFDGVIHGVPYAGGGFNAQFGDLIIRTNYVHHQRNGIGTVSIVGGSVTGNNFYDNKWAIALWGGEWTSLISHDVTIQNNQVAYNGFAFTPTGYPVGVGIFIRYAMDPNYPGSDPGPNAGDPNYPGIDASTIHINYNCFTDLGVVAGTKAIHHAALGVNDAVLNAYSPAAPIPGMFGPGAVTYSPWLTGASYSGATSFAVGSSVLLKADVSASSGGPYAGIPVAFYVDGNYVGSAVTDAAGTATLDWGVQPLGTYSVVASASGGCISSAPTAVSVTLTPTTMMYNGVFLDVDGNNSSILTATLSSAVAACVANQPLVFTVTPASGPPVIVPATTDPGGKATVTVPLGPGVYSVNVLFVGDAYCSGSSDDAVLTVASSGSSVYGGGWYKATTAPTTKASFGLVAQKKTDKKTGSVYYTGNLVWVHHKKNRLKSTSISAIGATTVSGYSKSVLVSGTGQLSSWIVDGSNPDGGYWSAPVTVGFVATVCDGGVVTVKKTPTDKPDAFGISIGGSTIALPGETGPIVLSGGSIKVN